MFNFLKKDAKGPSEFVLRRRKEIEDKIAALEMERIMLDQLSQLSRHLKLQSLFPLLDQNEDGSVSVAELAEGWGITSYSEFWKKYRHSTHWMLWFANSQSSQSSQILEVCTVH